MLDGIDLIAWDFDGVVNRNIEKGVFVWQVQFTAETGIDLRAFNAHMFPHRMKPIVRGEADLMDEVAGWIAQSKAPIPAEAFLDAWFRCDALPDAEIVALMARLRTPERACVIATNNEHRRAAYIENEMGFAGRIDRMFASGRMKQAKPDRGFFDRVCADMGVNPERALLIDDTRANVEAARSLGWNAIHYDGMTAASLEAWLRA
jgi:putative hydrolase of the HAD superfamily